MKELSSLFLIVTLILETGMTYGAPPDNKLPRVTFLTMEERQCRNPHPLTGLRELGYEDGKNIVIECRHAGGKDDHLPRVAEELARSRPAVIIALNHVWAMVAQGATKEIPIVIISSGDPVEAGFAKTMARPGGNVTGLTYFATELSAKRLEFLKTLVPELKRVAVLANPKTDPVLYESYLRETRAAAKKMEIELILAGASTENELMLAFEKMVDARAQAVYVFANVFFGEQAEKIADLGKWHNLPIMHFHKRFPTVGGLMAYAPDYDVLHRRTANYVDKILKGANPAELPFEQPERFELAINLATARELGLKVPQELLFRADKVIE